MLELSSVLDCGPKQPVDVTLLMATLGRKKGTLWGQRRLQKAVAVLRFKYKVPFTFYFIHHISGLWSEQLWEALELLCSTGLVEHKWRPSKKDAQDIPIEEEGYRVTAVGRDWLRAQETLALAANLKPWAVDTVLKLSLKKLSDETLWLNITEP